jgi:hypothetical protein
MCVKLWTNVSVKLCVLNIAIELCVLNYELMHVCMELCVLNYKSFYFTYKCYHCCIIVLYV